MTFHQGRIRERKRRVKQKKASSNHRRQPRRRRRNNISSSNNSSALRVRKRKAAAVEDKAGEEGEVTNLTIAERKEGEGISNEVIIIIHLYAV